MSMATSDSEVKTTNLAEDVAFLAHPCISSPLQAECAGIEVAKRLAA